MILYILISKKEELIEKNYFTDINSAYRHKSTFEQLGYTVQIIESTI